MKKVNVKITLDNLIPKIKNLINKYHKLFSLPLYGEHWEEILNKSFEDIGVKTSWVPKRSHKVGEDMRLIKKKNFRISCKSGQIFYSKILDEECVKFNGGRSTSFSSLKSKINHFSNNHEDYYFLLAKSLPKEENKNYSLLVFKSSICKVNKLKWQKSVSGKIWEGRGKFYATINKSMSSQLWTTLPLSLIKYKFKI